MTDLFLSYKAEDRARIAPLVAALESDGLSVWWDAHIGGGDDWRETILRHLETARCVIVIWSKRSIGPHGQFVRDEASRALKRGCYLPIRIDKVSPPLGFGESQSLDLCGWNGDRSDPHYQAILATVRSRLGIMGEAPKGLARAPKVSRRAVVAGGGVAAIAAAVSGWFVLKRDSSGGRNSIAVLPFANLSGDPAQAYFSDGIAEELRNALSRIAGLTVVARTSSEAMRDTDAKTAARRLGVANILTGSVRRSPSMIRVNAQLVDGRNGIERWSEIYDRPAGDALQIQTDIANRVAETLSIRLGGDDRRRLAEGGTNNPEAHDLLLNAQAAVEQDISPEGLQRAIGIAHAAIELDPKYADAWATKARLLTVIAGSYARTAAEGQKVYATAEATARRAVALAPNARLGYSALATILDQRLHRRAALAQFEKLRSLPGEDGGTLFDYAHFLSELGRHEEALRIADRAVSFDPLNPRSYGTKAAVLFNARRYREAVEVMQRVIAMAPDTGGPRYRLGLYHMLLGNNAESAAEFERASRDNFLIVAWRAILAARQGNKSESERLLQEYRAVGSDFGHYQEAEILAQQGKRDEAILTLEKAWKARDPGLTLILVDPLLDPLRGEPRFQAFIERLDFPT